jgi:hypothetical protein
MIAIRLTYNGNVDWVYPFPLSLLQSWHRERPIVCVSERGGFHGVGIRPSK